MTRFDVVWESYDQNSNDMFAESEGDVAAELGTNCNLGKTITSVCLAWRCPHHMLCPDVMCLNQKSLLRPFVTFYFIMTSQLLEIFASQVWSVNCVLHANDYCGGMKSIQTTKMWTSSLGLNLAFQHLVNKVQWWDEVSDSNLRSFIKWFLK
jgi:hypothetical protein